MHLYSALATLEPRDCIEEGVEKIPLVSDRLVHIQGPIDLPVTYPSFDF